MNAKEKMAVNMLNRGMKPEEIARKMRVSLIWLRLQEERVI